MSDDRRDRHRRWLAGFGFTERDWVRIKRLAETPSAAIGAALDDLDVPYRVATCEPGWETRFSGVLLGSWRGRPLLAWPMTEGERALWARRRRGRRTP